mmetsp:Transcript_1579/g.4604  ORF Transcript_1579/g.4604 Transcript_1579/m.4604 type:complete len:209 (-) Transcript_1579:37-663(-)
MATRTTFGRPSRALLRHARSSRPPTVPRHISTTTRTSGSTATMTTTALTPAGTCARRTVPSTRTTTTMTMTMTVTTTMMTMATHTRMSTLMTGRTTTTTTTTTAKNVTRRLAGCSSPSTRQRGRRVPTSSRPSKASPRNAQLFSRRLERTAPPPLSRTSTRSASLCTELRSAWRTEPPASGMTSAAAPETGAWGPSSPAASLPSSAAW